MLKRVLDFSRHISSKIDVTLGHIQWAALFKPRQRRVTAWDKPFDFFMAKHFDALNLLPNV
jgi:hypothetical protein